METLTQIIGWINQLSIGNPYCDTTIIFLVILGGYFARRNLSALPINITYTTLFAGTAFSCIYLLLMHFTGQRVNLVKAFISYCIATSLYDLFVKQIEGYLENKKR